MLQTVRILSCTQIIFAQLGWRLLRALRMLSGCCAEVAIPEKWVGKSLSELKIREQYGINAVGIIQGEKVEVTLDPYAPLPKDAILILIGATAVLEKFHTWK